MLSNITIMILALMTPLLSVFCFIKGYNACASTAEKEKINLPSIKIKRKSNNIQENERISNLLNNIDIYDGTEKGQKAING